jgi:serine/threonine protein kinase
MPGNSPSLVSRLSSLLSDRFTNFKSLSAQTGNSPIVSAIRIEDSVPVALKYVEGANGELEANMLRNNQHPNIIPLLGHIPLDVGSCLVLPLAPLGDLGKFMNSRRFSFLGDDSTNGWRLIVRQMLLPVEFLHSRGIIHNDIKLENYVVFGTAAQPIIKLIDFGISCQSETATALGTFEYSAPEKFVKQPVTNKSDIWSVAMTVYVAVRGQRPFAVKTSNANHRRAIIGRSVTRGSIPFEPRFWVEYPELEEFIRSALITDPADRPSAAALLEHPILRQEGSS